MKYHLTYDAKAHPEGIEKEQVPDGQGGCTAVVIGSLLYPEDGSYSTVFASLDGRTGEPLSDDELWKAWTMLTHQLGMSPTLTPNKKALCNEVFGIVKQAILSARDEEAHP